jgi:RND family efflux transporter MFP subunit
MPDTDLEKLRIRKSAPQPGAGRAKRVAWALLLAGALAAAAVSYRQGWLSPALEVRTAAVQKVFPAQTFTLLNASGYVVADRKSAVASKLTGRLVTLNVEEGSRVREGEVVAQLESRDAVAARERAARNVEVAHYNLEQARAELVNATQDYERKRSLVDRGTIARSVFDTAEARFRAARAAVEGLTAARSAAQSALQEATILLDYTNIRAPFDAVVLTKNAEVGDIVTPLAATADAKAAVVTVADMRSLMVQVDVSESNIAQVRVGQPCEIRLDAFPDTRFQGRVHMILPTADRTKASITVKVAFYELSPAVLPEMSAKVAFLAREPKADELAAFTAVPAAAVVSGNGGDRVFVIAGDRASETAVALGRRVGTLAELLQGPPVGTRVAVDPVTRLRDGMRVSPAKP